MKNPVFAVAALSLVLTACAAPGTRAPGARDVQTGGITPELVTAGICNFPRFRCILVTLTDTAAGKEIVDPLKTAFQGGNHVIVWIPPQGFIFPNDGITINTAYPGDEFTCFVAPGGNFFVCLNRHTVGSMADPREYKYTIKVQNVTKPSDPHIVNN